MSNNSQTKEAILRTTTTTNVHSPCSFLFSPFPLTLLSLSRLVFSPKMPALVFAAVGSVLVVVCLVKVVNYIRTSDDEYEL